MARGIIWSVIILSVFALTSCQKKAKEEAQPVEVQAVSLDESAQAAATTGAEQMVPAQAAQGVEATAGAIGAAAQNAAGAVQETVAIATGANEKPTVERIQEALKNAGIYTGAIDGKLGPKTKQAIENFQAKNNLTADGKVGPKTWASLSRYLTAQPAAAATSASEPSSQINY